VLLVAGCGSATPQTEPVAQRAPLGAGATINVPADAPTITAAVARAKPGDLVLIAPGTYHEAVAVNTADITLRGLDRNAVILDQDVLRPNGITVTAPGVAIQNLTVRNALLNGVLVTGEKDTTGVGVGRGSDGYTPLDTAKFPPLQGFLVDHVTSYNNGLYGIYAFDAQHGAIVDSYASGHPDSGLYVGQCKPCDIAVHDNVAERNAVGYEGANSSNGVYVYRNRFVGNRVGLTNNSDHQEAFVPQTGADIVGNLIANNHEAATPVQADGGWGIGVGIAGGTHNRVARNLIEDNPAAGVVLTNADDLAPIGNQVSHNSFGHNGLDVLYSASPSAPGSGNELNGVALIRGSAAGLPKAPAGIAFTDVAAPPAQPNLADAATAPRPTVTGLPGPMDLASIAVPGKDLLADRSAVTW